MGRTKEDTTAHQQHKKTTFRCLHKAQIALEALKETKTVAKIASDHQLHPNLVTK